MAQPTREEMEAYLRAAAVARGLDPDFWAKVVEGESRWNPAARARTSKEDSGGLLQLNTKNGLGVEALKRGINPHDPEQWQQQIDFGLDEGKKSYKPWTVARQLKGEATPGIPTNPVARGATANTAAPAADTLTLPRTEVEKLISQTTDPWADMLAEREKERQAQQQAQAPVAPPPQPPAPPVPVPAAPPVDYSALLMPRLRRGLLAEQGYGLLA